MVGTSSTVYKMNSNCFPFPLSLFVREWRFGNTMESFLELFGALPPKELKAAQNEAKEALQMYIRAANSALEILRLTSA